MAAELYPVGGSASAYVPADVGRAFWFVVALERLIAAKHLRIAAVADLHPRRIAVLDRLPAQCLPDRAGLGALMQHTAKPVSSKPTDPG